MFGAVPGKTVIAQCTFVVKVMVSSTAVTAVMSMMPAATITLGATSMLPLQPHSCKVPYSV